MAEDMKIEADMKARMKTKVISALSACIYNLMECFGLAGFLMVLVIPWMVVLLGFKFSEEGAGMGEDEAQREGDGVLEGRCDPLSGDEDVSFCFLIVWCSRIYLAADRAFYPFSPAPTRRGQGRNRFRLSEAKSHGICKFCGHYCLILCSDLFT